MNRDQGIKILKVAIVTTIILLLFEIIFSIDAINIFFASIIYKSNGIMVYLAIWLVMFLSTTFINIPAYTVLAVSASVGIHTWSWQFILTIMAAYIAGVVVDYWLGRWFGSKAVKWCAGSQEDFDKWCKVLNSKGKWWYLASVILPVFPDDLMCIVAGAVKFKFGFFVFANLIGRLIGLLVLLGTITLIGQIGGGFPIMIIIWGAALAIEVILYITIKKNKKILQK